MRFVSAMTQSMPGIGVPMARGRGQVMHERNVPVARGKSQVMSGRGVQMQRERGHMLPGRGVQFPVSRRRGQRMPIQGIGAPRARGRGQMMPERGVSMGRGKIMSMDLSKGQVILGKGVQMARGGGQIMSGSGIPMERIGGQMMSTRCIPMERGRGGMRLGRGVQMTGGSGEMRLGRGVQMARGRGEMRIGRGVQLSRGRGEMGLGRGVQMTRGRGGMRLGRGVQLSRGRGEMGLGRGVQMTRGRGGMRLGRGVQMARGSGEMRIGRGVQMSRGRRQMRLGRGFQMARGSGERGQMMSERVVPMVRERGHLQTSERSVQMSRSQGQTMLGRCVPIGSVREQMPETDVSMARVRGQMMSRGGIQTTINRGQMMSGKSVPMTRDREHRMSERDIQMARGRGQMMLGRGVLLSEETDEMEVENLHGFAWSTHEINDTIDLSDSNEDDIADLSEDECVSFSIIKVAQKKRANNMCLNNVEGNGNFEFDAGPDRNFNIESNDFVCDESVIESNEEAFHLDSAEFIIEMNQTSSVMESEVTLDEAQEDLGRNRMTSQDVSEGEIILVGAQDLKENGAMTSQDASNTVEGDIILVEDQIDLRANDITSKNASNTMEDDVKLGEAQDFRENGMTSQDASNTMEGDVILIDAQTDLGSNGMASNTMEGEIIFDETEEDLRGHGMTSRDASNTMESEIIIVEDLEDNGITSGDDPGCLICIESDNEDEESFKPITPKNVNVNLKRMSEVKTNDVDKVNVKVDQKKKDLQCNSIVTTIRSSPNRERVSRKHIRKLKKALLYCAKQINKLDETVVDWEKEDNSYELIFRYKKRFMQIYRKIAQIEKSSADLGWKSDKPFHFDQSKYPQMNKTIEKFMNRTKTLPDFKSFHSLLKKANEENNLLLTEIQLSDEAERMFQKVGVKLKSRRKADEAEVMSAYLARCDVSAEDDPADNDEELEDKLRKNSLLGKRNYDQVMQELEEKRDAETETVGSNEENGEGEDTEEEDENSETENDIDLGIPTKKLKTERNAWSDEEDVTIWHDKDFNTRGELQMGLSSGSDEAIDDESSDGDCSENDEGDNTSIGTIPV